MSQPDFLYELFEDFMDDPVNQDFSMDNGLVCRWMTGQAKISPKISAYYSKPSNQEKLAHTIHQNLLPLMSDCNMAIPQIANYAMFLTEQQEPERGISELQKLSGIIKEYHSDECLDYVKVQETLATIYLMTTNLSQAKTHLKKAFKIYASSKVISLSGTQFSFGFPLLNMIIQNHLYKVGNIDLFLRLTVHDFHAQ